MNTVDFRKLIEVTHSRRVELREKKSKDYASEADTLDNFKRMSLLCETLDIDLRRSAWDVAMFFVVFKVDRWCNLRRVGRTPENESVLDTVIDGHNYWDLALGCAIDEEKQNADRV